MLLRAKNMKLETDRFCRAHEDRSTIAFASSEHVKTGDLLHDSEGEVNEVRGVDLGSIVDRDWPDERLFFPGGPFILRHNCTLAMRLLGLLAR